MAIAVEDLAACGVRTFIRVGSCASITERLSVGRIMVETAAVCDEGTSRYYAAELSTGRLPRGQPRERSTVTIRAGRIVTTTRSPPGPSIARMSTPPYLAPTLSANW